MLKTVDFEIFGKVQGVFFRKHTAKEGKRLGLTGWCMNTPDGTVVGTMEGDASKILEMQRWLKYVGSPQSRIDRAVFKNDKAIQKRIFPGFEIRR